MKFLRDSFRLEKPKQLESDEKREKLLRQHYYANLVGGLFFIGLGIYRLFQQSSIVLPEVVQTASRAVGYPLVVIVLAYVLIVRISSAKFDMSPKDEYETAMVQARLAKNYNFMSLAILGLLAFAWNAKNGVVIGILAIVYGVSMLMDGKASAYDTKTSKQ